MTVDAVTLEARALLVWTGEGSKNTYLTQHLRAGVVWCNTLNMFDPASPFGEYGESGFGREGGVHGSYEYLAG